MIYLSTKYKVLNQLSFKWSAKTIKLQIRINFWLIRWPTNISKIRSDYILHTSNWVKFLIYSWRIWFIKFVPKPLVKEVQPLSWVSNEINLRKLIVFCLQFCSHLNKLNKNYLLKWKYKILNKYIFVVGTFYRMWPSILWSRQNIYLYDFEKNYLNN